MRMTSGEDCAKVARRYTAGVGSSNNIKVHRRRRKCRQKRDEKNLTCTQRGIAVNTFVYSAAPYGPQFGLYCWEGMPGEHGAGQGMCGPGCVRKTESGCDGISATIRDNVTSHTR